MPLNNIKTFSQLPNNHNAQNNYSFNPSVEGLKLINVESDAISKSALSCSIWNNLLKINISNAVREENGRYTIDTSCDTPIYLSVTKAAMLSDILKKFLANKEIMNGYGIVCGKSLITINYEKPSSQTNHISAIRIIRFDTENIVSMANVYQFHTDYYPIINNVSINNGVVNYSNNYSKYNDIEIKLLITQIDEFIKSMMYSYSYSYLHSMTPIVNSIYNGIDTIVDKVDGNKYWKSNRR